MGACVCVSVCCVTLAFFVLSDGFVGIVLLDICLSVILCFKCVFFQAYEFFSHVILMVSF